MKIILSVDAVTPPLSGIGHYAFQLCAGLPQLSDLDALRFFLMGSWVDNPALNKNVALSTAKVKHSARYLDALGHLRGYVARSRAAMSVYSKLSPVLFYHRLKPFEDYLFHAPNFIIPPFPGKSIATFHDLSIDLYPEFHPVARVNYMKRLLPDTLKRVNYLITDSEAVRQEVIRHYSWPSDRIRSVPLAANPRFMPRTQEALQPVLQKYGLSFKRYLLFVSTIEPRKNVMRLLQAHALLPQFIRQRYPLVLVGAAGWNSQDIHKAMASASQGSIHYLSYVPQQDLPLLYSGAKLFTFPSIYEGFGLPILEAMASGVPVITSNRSCMPEVAGDAALLVEPEDVEDIYHAMLRGLEDGEYYQQRVEQGLANAQQYSWQRCVQETASVYRDVIDCY